LGLIINSTENHQPNGDPSEGNQFIQLSSRENADAISMLSKIDWFGETVESVELNLKNRLKHLEDENIDFLLCLQGEGNTPKGPSESDLDKIINAVDILLRQVKNAEKWTEESESTLEKTSSNLTQFESLNNQLEVHFKNNVALQEQLDAMIKVIKSHMQLILFLN